jgi:transposase InsO family protein
MADVTRVSSDGRNLDDFYLGRTGNDEIQLDLLLDYQSNVALYDTIPAYLREHQPPVLPIWGRNDPFFVPAGAEAFRRDVPAADVRFVDATWAGFVYVAFVIDTYARRIVGWRASRAAHASFVLDAFGAGAS